MKEYGVEIEEVLQKVIKVKEVNEEEAMRIVKEKYRNEEIVLDSEDFVSICFK